MPGRETGEEAGPAGINVAAMMSFPSPDDALLPLKVHGCFIALNRWKLSTRAPRKIFP